MFFEFFVRFQASTGAWCEESVSQARDRTFVTAFTGLLKDNGMHPMSTFHYGGTAIDPELGTIIDWDTTPEKLMMTSGETIYISAYKKRPSVETAPSSRMKLKPVPHPDVEASASSGSAASAVRGRWRRGSVEMPAAAAIAAAVLANTRVRTPSRSPRRAAAKVRAKETCAAVKPLDEGDEESQELEDWALKAWGRQSLEEARAAGLQSLQAATTPWRSAVVDECQKLEDMTTEEREEHGWSWADPRMPG